MRVYLFDIDGTLADLTHRLHHIQQETKDWDSFFDGCHLDAPIPHIVELCRTLRRKTEVVYVSGRSSRCRYATINWLMGQDLFGANTKLYMREEGDHRPDHEVKLDLLARIVADGFQPIMAFDDRNQVVEMWRAAGIPCAQVAPGDF